MKRILLSLLLSGAISLAGYAQQSVSIGTDQINSNAVLWLQGNGSQGLILPVVTNRTNVTASKGMVVFDDSDKKVYYNNGTIWVEVGGGGDGVAQTLSLSGNTLSISSGNSVQIANTAPTSAGQLLQWNGTQWTSSNATPPTIGQVLKWNGTSWAPGTDDAGGASIILNNGQLVTGNGTANAATTITGDVTLSGSAFTISNNAVNSAKIADGSILGTDLNPMSATNGQVLKFNGTTWAPAADDAGVGATPTLSNGQILTGNGTTNSATTLTGDATLNGGTLTIANNVINGAKIADGSVSSAEIEDGTIIANDLNSMGATNGQVLQFNGTLWNPATLATGSGTVTNVSGNGPISVTTPTTTPVISISQANGTTNGFLLSTDWAAFNAKLGIASTTGGDLSGTVVNPTVIAIQGRAVASTVPTNGQILKFNGTSWAPAADDVGGGATPTLSNGQILIGDGSSNSGVALSGDATLSAGALTIANNAINSAKIADSSIQAADLNSMGATANQVLQFNGTSWAPALLPVGSGTVTSVGLTLPSIFTVTGSPITTTGVLNATLASQPAATVFAAPTGSAGAPTFRTLAATDIPDLDASKITTGILSIAQGGTGATTPGAALANLGAMNNTLNAGEIFVGNASDIATGVAVSGDATMSSAGTLTVGNNAINSAKILDGTIVNADVNAAAAIAGTKISPNFGAQLVQSSSGANISLGAGANLTGINVLVPGTSGNSTGIISMSNGAGAVNYGIRGVATNGGTNYGLYGDATGASGSNYGIYARATNGFAGFFEGNMGLIGGLGLGGTPDFGVAGQVLTSAGPGTTPAWSTIAGGGSLQSAYDGGNTITLAAATPIDITGTESASPAIRINDGFIETIDVGDDEDAWFRSTSGTSWLFGANNQVHSGGFAIGKFGDMLFAPFFIDPVTSNIGIGGATAPSSTLDVAGDIEFSGALLPNNLAGASGQILTSAGPGLPPTWTTPSGSTLISNPGTNNLFAGVGAGTVNTAANGAFFGAGAGQANTTGADNTFIGRGAGQTNTTSGFNTYVGKDAGLNATGSNNAFLGFESGQSAGSTSGSTLIGSASGVNSTGQLNTFVGRLAGVANTTGQRNTLLGDNTNVGAAGLINATAIGSRAFVNQNNTIVLGSIDGVNGANANTRVGIGTTTPRSVLELQSGNLTLSGSAGSPADAVDIDFIRQDNNNLIAKIWTDPLSNTLWISTHPTAPTTNKHFTVDPTGNIGIANTAPSQKLDVTGNVRFSGALMPNNLAGTAGQVLTSAGAGLPPTWTTAAGASSLQGAYDGGQTMTGIAAMDLNLDNGFVARGTYLTGSIPATGAGTRFMWYPRKGAIRAGTVEDEGGGEQARWNDASVGEYSISMGYNTQASGTNAIALGKRARALGFSSVVLGDGGSANGAHGVALGFGNNANGDNSFVVGRYNVANTFGGVAVGLFNSSLPGSVTTWVATDPVFEVGNGTDFAARSNALTILKNGNAGFSRTPSTNRLEVNGEASKTTAGTWIANSDRRIKTNIKDITNGIETVKKLRPVMFKYTAEWMERNPTIKNQYYYNFIAQEFQEVFPEAVQGSGEYLKGDGQEILQIDTYNAQIVSIKAIQELIAKIENLEAENQKLKAEKGSLESKVSEIEAQQQELSKSLEEIKKMLGAQAKK